MCLKAPAGFCRHRNKNLARTKFGRANSQGLDHRRVGPGLLLLLTKAHLLLRTNVTKPGSQEQK